MAPWLSRSRAQKVATQDSERVWGTLAQRYTLIVFDL